MRFFKPGIFLYPSCSKFTPMKKFIYLLALLPAMASCFHKDVMTDPADNVEQSLIYVGTEGTFIITKEEVFQATSKQSGGGITRISGYSEYRLTSYDLQTGEQKGRVEMGDGQEQAFIILGYTSGKLWLYSVDPELGLHCRHPETMEVLKTEAELSSAAPLQNFDFARPEWSLLGSQYGFDYEAGQLILSDMQDYHYHCDPDKNTLVKTDAEINDYTFGMHPAGGNVYFNEDDYISILNDGRQPLKWENEENPAVNLTFLDGEILIDMNTRRTQQMRLDQIAATQKIIDQYTDSMKTLEAKFPDLSKDNNNYWYSTSGSEAYIAYGKYGNYKRDREDLQRDLDMLKIDTDYLDGYAPLSPEQQKIIVIHGTNVSDTSHLQISYVHCTENSQKEAWKCLPPGLYRDPDKADNLGAFETVMSDGNPTFDYVWADYDGDYLVLIWQLQMLCIDVKSGQIIWQKTL